MLANPTLETMTGAVLLGDADLSLGIQDQLKCGNKVRVLLAGPGPLSLMVSLLIDQTFRAERDLLCVSRSAQCQPQAGEVSIAAAAR